MTKLQKLPYNLGFTLIEVLIALSIVAITLVAGSNAFLAFSNSLQRQNDALLAQLCAENTLLKIKLSRQLPAIGEESSECVQAERKFTVELEVQTTLNASFRRANALVKDEKMQPILQLSAVFSRN